MIMEPWKAYLIWHAARNNSCRTHSLSIVGNIPKGLTECILDLPRILIALPIAMGDSTNRDFTVSSHSFAGFCCMLLLCQRSLINYREGNYIEIAWCFLKLCIKLFHTLETFYLSSFFNNCFLIKKRNPCLQLPLNVPWTNEMRQVISASTGITGISLAQALIGLPYNSCDISFENVVLD